MGIGANSMGGHLAQIQQEEFQGTFRAVSEQSLSSYRVEEPGGGNRLTKKPLINQGN